MSCTKRWEAHRAQKEASGGSGPRFGNSLRLREEAADQWGWAWLDRLSQDLRFAGRLLRRAPAFTLTAIGVLALGVGINLAAFQVFDMVALSWLPIRSPETLVKLLAAHGLMAHGSWLMVGLPEP